MTAVALDPWLGAVPAAVVTALRGARDVLVVSHENPDADTLGAALALRWIVEAGGGRTTLVCSDVPPPLYDFLPGIEAFRQDPEPDRAHDLAVLVDCGSLERVGPLRERQATLFERLPHVVIDHHASNGAAGPADWVDPGSAATCELVTLLATSVGVPLTAGDGALATVLMAGIVMDTATFAHPNATPRTLAVSAALVAAGAPLAEISRRLYRTKPDVQLRLFGRVLDRLETAAGGLVIHSTLTSADITETGAMSAHSEGIIDLLSQSEAAEVAILFKEADPATTRISVRTKPGGVDATVLTGSFGGGGHARAAGASLPANVAEARRRVLPEAERLAVAVRR
ncbi:MAG TPA: DHH family phosphoesterase [Candidatus Limnocylindrales bacterium]|nr:DHH family phosphoesterase [Candidatus Limnocylindrales bacterium]